MLNKFKWVLTKLYLWLRSVLVLRGGDGTILASYPKTGSTWVRYFLFLTLLQRKENLVEDIDTMNEVLPEFAHKSMFNSWQFEESSPFIKTHQVYHSFFCGRPALLVVRDPRDIVVSYYHYSKGVKKIDYEGTFSELIRHKSMGLEAFMKHYDSWQSKAGLIVKYEELKDEPHMWFSRIAQFCGLERTADEISQAVEGADFSRMKKVQARSQDLRSEFKEGHEFVRSGKKSQWKDLFSEEDIVYYESLKEKYDFHLYD